jgi:probable rRNA maturation factor
MRRELVLRNRQLTRRVDLRMLRRIAETVLRDHLEIESYELGIHLIGVSEMSRLSEQFLQHEGSTDVITFDHTENARGRGQEAMGEWRVARGRRGEAWEGAGIYGEIFISVDDAVRQARQFRTSWQVEVVRYVIHGLLHLRGHDDLQAAARRRMKRVEGRLLRRAGNEFALRELDREAQRLGARTPAVRRVSGSGE